LLNLTPEEKRVYNALFQQADTDRLGVVTGEVAAKFFEKSKLAPNILGEVWIITLCFKRCLPADQYNYHRYGSYQTLKIGGY